MATMLPMDTSFNQAYNYLEAARVAQLDLRDQYELPPTERDQGRIAGLHQIINYGFKAAEVHATLAVAQEVKRLTTRAFPIIIEKKVS